MGQVLFSVNIDMESIHELCELFAPQIEKGIFYNIIFWSKLFELLIIFRYLEDFY